jgi:SAM-dependent methyltransferase
MSTDLEPTSREFFERKYAENADPWNFAHDPYELSRYEEIIQSLRERRYGRAYEPGCSVGVLTQKLAPLCGHLLAVDLSETAILSARGRCASYSNVRFETRSVVEVDPGPLDLLVLSEIGYYFQATHLRTWVEHLTSCLRPGAILLTCHWLGASADHLLDGDVVHEIVKGVTKQKGYMQIQEQRTESYILGRWQC